MVLDFIIFNFLKSSKFDAKFQAARSKLPTFFLVSHFGFVLFFHTGLLNTHTYSLTHPLLIQKVNKLFQLKYSFWKKYRENFLLNNKATAIMKKDDC